MPQSDESQLAAQVQSKLSDVQEELETLQERFADFKRQLDGPTRTVKARIRQPVIISTEVIGQLWTRLEDEPGRPVLICSTTDGRITTWRTLDAALDQANALDREIEGTIVQNELSSAKGSVELYPDGVLVSVFGEREKAERLFADLYAKVLTGVRGKSWLRLVREAWPQRVPYRRRAPCLLRGLQERRHLG